MNSKSEQVGQVEKTRERGDVEMGQADRVSHVEKKPSCCLALVQVLEIWVFHLRSLVTVTPRKVVTTEMAMEST